MVLCIMHKIIFDCDLSSLYEKLLEKMADVWQEWVQIWRDLLMLKVFAWMIFIYYIWRSDTVRLKNRLHKANQFSASFFYFFSTFPIFR